MSYKDAIIFALHTGTTKFADLPIMEIRPCALLNKNNDIALSLFFKMGNE